ncbi:OstA-like protein [Fluviicola sp.]|uniref:OstA-like protein n=1 Tax=Fluviicola sp. TaxID=1917219 RepID=UPI0031DA4017
MCTHFSYGQNWLELLPGAKKLSYDERTGKQRLTGFLNFKYQGNVMFCDSAHYKEKTNEVWAYGKVQINKADTLNLFCDSLYYNGRTKLAKLWGHVRIRDREYKVTSDSLDYDAASSKAIYRNKGKIENITTNEVLTSKFGYFYPNTEEAFFKGDVVYKSDNLKLTTDTLHYNYLVHKVFFYGPTVGTTKDSKFYCDRGWYHVETEEGLLTHNAKIDQAPRIITGDSLFYAPKRKYALGKGNVQMVDTAQKVQFNAGHFTSDGNTLTDVLTDFPLIRIMKSKDTLFLRADTLVHLRDTLEKTLRIRGGQDVRIFQNKIQGVSDSLDYKKADGIMDLWGNAHFWSYNSELTGDTIRVFIVNDTLIQKAHLYPKAFAANELDSGRYYNQLAGKEIWSYFKNNELVRSDVIGQAKTIFYPEDEEKTDTAIVVKRMGLNRIFSSDIKVYLDSGEVVGVSYINQPDGKFFPMDQIDKEEQFLPEFKWHPLLRPKTWQELLKPREIIKEEEPKDSENKRKNAGN